MKIIMTLFLGLMLVTAQGQSTAKAELKKSVLSFVEFGDSHNADGLNQLLHNQHRLIWNDGEKAPFIADKDTYLAKISSKEWGGDQREVKIESIQIFDEANASVKAVLDGEQAEMRSIFLLVRENDQWKIITELVNATFK